MHKCNFKKKPDLKIIQPILETFGLDNLEDDRFFTKEHMKEIKTIENMINLHKNLEEYYLPCKSKIYLASLNEKKVITILRQFVKNHNYKVDIEVIDDGSTILDTGGGILNLINNSNDKHLHMAKSTHHPSNKKPHECGAL